MPPNKKKKKEKKEDEKQPPLPPKQVENEKPEDFDFGGLPQRDLKKNLGCG